ncbi:MAG: thiamine-phosphate kinase [Holophagaceae bacterium]|nr:thiamine-phosphate kinase [Holophagaceae bacterium]
MKPSESGIIEFIRQNFLGGEDLTDDCGIIPSPSSGETLLATSDIMESGQHFRLEWHPPKMLGRKLLAVNLSDLDASGARPLGFLLTIALGSDIDSEYLQQLLEGLATAARGYNIPIIGGDTVGRKSGLGLGITAFGVAKRRLHRCGVLEGDNIFVDTMPGASHTGLQKLVSGERWVPESPDHDILVHLDPRPEIGLGVKLAEIPQVHACIDLSDGLSKDLRMLAVASGLSIVIGHNLSDDALYGGEDYSRCFASSLDAESLQKLTGRKFHTIARAVPKTESPLLRYSDGNILPVDDKSFGHFVIV